MTRQIREVAKNQSTILGSILPLRAFEFSVDPQIPNNSQVVMYLLSHLCLRIIGTRELYCVPTLYAHRIFFQISVDRKAEGDYPSFDRNNLLLTKGAFEDQVTARWGN